MSIAPTCDAAELRGDREAALAAVKQNALALKYASVDLRRDREVVLAAVKQNGRAIKWAPPLIRKLRGEWPRVRLLFVGHADGRSPLSWLPAELVGGPLMAALLRVL